MGPIDRNAPIPVYFQLKTLLLEQIVEGRYGPGERLPTEHELCREFGISRTPVTRALSELAEEGVVVRRRRRGTFVNPHWARKNRPGEPVRIIVTEEKWQEWLTRLAPEGTELDVACFVALPRLHRSLTRLVGEGRAPDIALVDSVSVTEFARSGFIVPLEELDPAWFDTEFRTDFLPPFVDALSIDGQVYGVPEEGNVSGIWYRRDALDDAPPATWEELLEVGREIVAAGRHPVPMAMPGGSRAGETTTYCLLGLLASNGVGVLRDGTVTLDTGATVDALRFVRTLVEEGIVLAASVAADWDQPIRDLASGRAAISAGGSYEASVLAEALRVPLDRLGEHVVFAPFPAGPEGEPASVLGAMAYVVFRQSRQPKRALEVVQHVMATELLARRASSQPTIPPRRSTIELVAEESAFVADTARLLERAWLRPRTESYHLVSSQLQTMLEAVITGRLGPAAATERAAEMIGAITGLPVAH